MGQRLVITISQNGFRLANAYFHWSNFTDIALDLTNNIIGYLELANEGSNVGDAAWALYKAGAQFSEKEIERMQKEDIDKDRFYFADSEYANRIDGLLCVSEEGMDENDSLAESDVVIDTGSNQVIFGAIHTREAEDKDVKSCYPTLPSDLAFDADQWNNFYTRAKRVLAISTNAISEDKRTLYSFIA